METIYKTLQHSGTDHFNNAFDDLDKRGFKPLFPPALSTYPDPVSGKTNLLFIQQWYKTIEK